jgi:hypothetical protein
LLATVKVRATRFLLLDLCLLAGILLRALHLHRRLRLYVHQDLALDGCRVMGRSHSLVLRHKLNNSFFFKIELNTPDKEMT